VAKYNQEKTGVQNKVKAGCNYLANTETQDKPGQGESFGAI